jgi:hypothetical protein
VEFGVESYNEANTIFLMMKDNWRGLIMDGSQKNMDTAKRRSNFWRHDLTAVTAFIDRDNINSLISDAGFAGEIGLLSLDIDGNDYWVWEKLTVANPIIVVAEYNSVFGASHAISVPYEAKFQRNKAHYSNLYWGCSIRALEYLADKKGYALVGSNSAGNNVFFVRRDRLGDLKPVISSAAWVDARFRESLDEAGNLTYSSGEARGRLISDLKVVDVVDGQVRRFGDLEKS